MQALSLMRIRRSGPALARVAVALLNLPWLLILSLVWPASGLAAALKDVEFASLPGNQVRIELVPVSYTHLTLPTNREV